VGSIAWPFFVAVLSRSCPRVSKRACLFALDAVTSCEIYFLTQVDAKHGASTAGNTRQSGMASTRVPLEPMCTPQIKEMSAMHGRRKLSVDA
jgi:hypothetical protein